MSLAKFGFLSIGVGGGFGPRDFLGQINFSSVHLGASMKLVLAVSSRCVDEIRPDLAPVLTWLPGPLSVFM